MHATDGRDQPRTPGAVDVAVLFAATIGLWMAVRAVGTPLVELEMSLAFAAASAGMTGLPALAWCLDRGRGSLGLMLAAGLLAGVLPPLILLASGVAGLLYQSRSLDYVRWALDFGANVPMHGTLPWPAFRQLVAEAAGVGVSTAACVWIAGRAVGQRDASQRRIAGL